MQSRRCECNSHRGTSFIWSKREDAAPECGNVGLNPTMEIMKEYTVDADKIIYFKPRDVWAVPNSLLPEACSSKMQEEVLINGGKYQVVGYAAIHKSFGCSDMDILFKKVLEN